MQTGRTNDHQLARELEALREELVRARARDAEERVELEQLGRELGSLLERIRHRIDHPAGDDAAA